MAQIGKLQTWKIPEDKINNWRRLNPTVPKEEATDCVINSLHLLGVIDNPDFANILSEYANIKKNIDRSEILKLIFDKFNENNNETSIIHKIGSKSDLELRNELKNNSYTIALFSRRTITGKISGHAVILTKQNNIYYILDPQQQTMYCELTNLYEYIKKQEYYQVEFILKSKITRKRNETTINIRKRKNVSPPTKKRRINSKNKTRSTSRSRISKKSISV